MAVVINGTTGIDTIQDDAVGLAQMASGTDGNLITYDASGNPAAVAVGTSGQVLTSNGAGAAPTMQDAAVANTPSWKVNLGSTQAVAASTWTKITFDTENWDSDSAFDSSTNYRFTVPSGKAGKYYCRTNVYISGLDDAESLHASIYKNGSHAQVYTTVYSPANGQEGWISMSNEIDLDVGDYLEVFIYHTDSGSNNCHATDTSFGGYRITT